MTRPLAVPRAKLSLIAGAREEVVKAVHQLESEGVPRRRIILMGRSLGASVGLLALARLEAEGGRLGGIIWEGAPLSSRDFAERLVPWYRATPSMLPSKAAPCTTKSSPSTKASRRAASRWPFSSRI